MVLLLKKVGYGGLASRNTSCQADYQHQDNDGSREIPQKLNRNSATRASATVRFTI
jgi:hypothetical protein